jgi:hypothetical protein
MGCKYCGKEMKFNLQEKQLSNGAYYYHQKYQCQCGAKCEVINGGVPRWGKPSDEQ